MAWPGGRRRRAGLGGGTMTLPTFMRRARVLLAVCLVLGLAGLGLLRLAALTPEFTDPGRAAALRVVDAPTWNSDELAAFTTRWHDEMRRLRTAKWPLHDGGLTLIALAATILGSAIVLRAPTFGALRRVRTPRSRAGLLALAAGVLVAPFPMATLWFSQVLDRAYYPPWSDSIGIPLAALMLLMIVTGPLAWLALWRMTRGSRPPARLGRRRRGPPTRRDRLADAACLAIAAFQALLVTDMVLTFYAPVVPFLAAVASVCASARALRLTRGVPVGAAHEAAA